MDCNKGEVIKAKALAEKKLAEKKLGERDIAGAKRFAINAQALCPELDGISQLLAILDVLISAENSINGEVDMYRVLGVHPFADDDTIRKSYRKLALMLHPDKNKSVGADEAFKLVSEAWSLLSDKAKRLSYDQKWNLRGIYSNVFNGKSSLSVPATQNGFHGFSNHNIFNAMDPRPNFHPIFVPPAPPMSLNTFWTSCSACKVQFEYLRTYLNRNLHCVNCHLPFVAVEMQAPPINGNNASTAWASYLRRRNFSRVHNVGPPRFSGIHSSMGTSQPGAFSKSGIYASVLAQPSSSAEAAADAQLSGEQLKRGRVVADKTVVGLDAGSSCAGSGSAVRVNRPKKRRHIDAQGLNNVEREMAYEGAKGNGAAGFFRSQRIGFETGRANIAGISKPDSTRELSQMEIRTMLMSKARIKIRRKLNEWSLASRSHASDKSKASDKAMNEKKQANGQAIKNGLEAGAKESAEFVDINASFQSKQLSTANSDVGLAIEEADSMSMSVPDPDFHDFDMDRAEKSFGDNQVWAAYDNDDGMPRYYALIHSVISRRPFKMRISWLNSKSNRELGPLNWIGSGFYKTSGDFWIGKYEAYKSLNSFSHKVKWSKGRKGAVQIYPMKGDVWALYRNWSPDWNELTPDEVIHKYDMVQVLEDYNEQKGVTVAPLIKVAGFMTVFQKHSEQSITRTIPREEMFRFSHQVPSYLLSGHEGPNASKGCLELDPAATPLELLKMFTEAQVKEMEEVAKKGTNEVEPMNLRRCEEKELVERGKVVMPNTIAEGVEKKVAEEVEGMETKKPVMLVYKRRGQRDRQS